MKIYLDMCCYNRPYDPQDQLNISMDMREKSDYTTWRKTYYDKMAPDEFHRNAVKYANDHPYTGKAERL